MNCPVCDAKLREVTKMNVQVDICPDCKGVWLDRGELEKIIDMVAQEGSHDAPSRPEPRREDSRREEPRREEYREERREYRDDYRGKDDYRYGRPKKKESVLSNIFDMFGGGDD